MKVKDLAEKIYVSSLNEGDNHYSISPTGNPANKKYECEYIRKDVVMHIIRGALSGKDALNKIISL